MSAPLLQLGVTGDPVERPYPGLRPFSEDESHLFFGRNLQRDECIRRLRLYRFLAVVGTSGAGKSSLVRAGIVPALRTGLLEPSGHEWTVLFMRPGATPMGSLAQCLSTLTERSDSASVREIETGLRRSSEGLTDVVEQLAYDKGNILLVVDQFEELFRLGREQQQEDAWLAERTAFIQRILEPRLQTDVPLYVMLTMRTDFIEDCAKFRNLPEALNESQFLVPRLTRPQLNMAIVRPAEVARLPLSHQLTQRVLDDAVDLADELPVVQHALMRTWQDWRNPPALQADSPETSKEADPKEESDLKAYRRIGTVANALNLHGDEVYGKLPTTDHRSAAKLLFQRITLRDASGKVTRSPAPLASVREILTAQRLDPDAVLPTVIAAFERDDCRFLMPPASNVAPENLEADITHEAILRVWGLCKGWIDAEYENAQSYRVILEYERRGQLLTGRLLAVSHNWWKTYKPSLAWAKRYHSPDKDFDELQKRYKADRLAPAHAGEEAQRKLEQEHWAQLLAWHSKQFDKAEKFLRRSWWARTWAHAQKLLLVAAVVAVGVVIRASRASDEAKARDLALQTVIDNLQGISRDQEATREWSALGPDQRSSPRAQKAAAAYWQRRTDQIRQQAEYYERERCWEEALLMRSYATERGPGPSKASDSAGSVDPPQQLAELFANVTGTVWLEGRRTKCSDTSAMRCESLQFAEGGVLVGLCGGALRSWKADGTPQATAADGAYNPAPNETSMALAQGWVWSSDGRGLLARPSLDAAPRRLNVRGCSSITDLAVSTDNTRLALACGGENAVLIDHLDHWYEGRGARRATNVTRAGRYINGVAWLEQKAVLATDKGVEVTGSKVPATSPEREVMSVRSFSDPTVKRIVYGTNQTKQRTAAVVVVDLSADLPESPWELPRSNATSYYVSRVAGGSTRDEVAAIVTTAGNGQETTELFLPAAQRTIELDDRAGDVAVGAFRGRRLTLVSLAGRVRVFSLDRKASLDWQHVQTLTGLTIRSDDLVISQGGGPAVRTFKEVFPP